MTDNEKILAKCAYELDDHSTEWAKGIANEHARLLPIIRALLSDRERLIACVEALEHMAMMSRDDLGGANEDLISDALTALSEVLGEK